MSTAAEQEQLVADCITRESKLTDWERQFIDEMERLLRNSRPLTHAQNEKLNEIWDRIT